MQRQLARNTVLEVGYNGNHSTRLPIIADYNQARPNAPGATLSASRPAGPIPTFGAITWVDPAGSNNYNGMSVALRTSLLARTLLPEFVHLVEGPRRLRTGARNLPRLHVANPQNIRNLQRNGPHQLRRQADQRHQRRLSAARSAKDANSVSNWNRRRRRGARRLGIEHHQYRNTGSRSTSSTRPARPTT